MSIRALQVAIYIAIVGLVSACRALDAGSRNPGEMIFEKLVSGMNLGEVNPDPPLFTRGSIRAQINAEV